jgi:hypothetical protein
MPDSANPNNSQRHAAAPLWQGTDPATQTRHVPQRCDPEHPDRCVGQTAKGQCPMLGMPHTYPRNNPKNGGNNNKSKPLCPLHGTPPRPSLYRIPNASVTARMAEMRTHPQNYTLENELALVRVLLETTLSQCNDAATLIIKSGPLLELTTQIDRLLGSNIKIAEKTGNLLSVEQVARIAQALIDIVADELERAYPEDETLVNGAAAQDHASFLASVATRFEASLDEPVYKGVHGEECTEECHEEYMEGEPAEGICVGGFLNTEVDAAEDPDTNTDPSPEDPEA